MHYSNPPQAGQLASIHTTSLYETLQESLITEVKKCTHNDEPYALVGAVMPGGVHGAAIPVPDAADISKVLYAFAASGALVVGAAALVLVAFPESDSEREELMHMRPSEHPAPREMAVVMATCAETMLQSSAPVFRQRRKAPKIGTWHEPEAFSLAENTGSHIEAIKAGFAVHVASPVFPGGDPDMN